MAWAKKLLWRYNRAYRYTISQGRIEEHTVCLLIERYCPSRHLFMYTEGVISSSSGLMKAFKWGREGFSLELFDRVLGLFGIEEPGLSEWARWRKRIFPSKIHISSDNLNMKRFRAWYSRAIVGNILHPTKVFPCSSNVASSSSGNSQSTYEMRIEGGLPRAKLWIEKWGVCLQVNILEKHT